MPTGISPSPDSDVPAVVGLLYFFISGVATTNEGCRLRRDESRDELCNNKGEIKVNKGFSAGKHAHIIPVLTSIEDQSTGPSRS
jgi:hypothetical protein